jgi:hypothetical protein
MALAFTIGKHLITTIASLWTAQALGRTNNWNFAGVLDGVGRRRRGGSALQNVGFVGVGVAVGVGTALFLTSEDGKQLRERIASKVSDVKRSTFKLLEAAPAEESAGAKRGPDKANARASSKKNGRASSHT